MQIETNDYCALIPEEELATQLEMEPKFTKKDCHGLWKCFFCLENQTRITAGEAIGGDGVIRRDEQTITPANGRVAHEEESREQKGSPKHS